MAGSWPLRVPLRWRVVLLLAVLAVFNVGFTALTRSEIARARELDQVAAGLVTAVRVEERLQAARDNQVLAIRAYALTGQAGFLRDYRVHRRVAAARAQQLAGLLRDEPALLRLEEQAEEAMADWRQQLAEPVVQAAPDKRARLGSRLVANVGEPLFDQVRAAADRLVHGMDARQQAIKESVQMARNQLNRRLMTMSVLTLLLVAGSAWALRRWITVPVATLSTQADRVADGELDVHIQVAGPEEFERIGENVERMRRRIVNELRASRQAVEALEQRAPLVSRMRDELRADTDVALPHGLQVIARLEPARGVLAGDWYDVIRLDEQRAGIVVVDVSGHGPEAGLWALWLKHLLMPAMRMGLEPGDALNWVAGEMGDTGEWFATCVIVEVEASTGACRYANAGHPPPLLLGPAGVEELGVTGPIFGPLPGQRWRTDKTTLGPDQMLVAYTDGITEARNDAGEEFGEGRLIACLRSNTARDVRSLTEDVMSTVHLFGSDRLKDDATLAVVTYGGTISHPATERPHAAVHPISQGVPAADDREDRPGSVTT
ncbi:MAG TPA: SpoIIE family protein phosphatase [Nocardioidaceae bacterium]